MANGPLCYEHESEFVDNRKEKLMRKLLNTVLYGATALVLFTGSAYGQSTVEVYKSPT